jgi:hypothetical protein
MTEIVVSLLSTLGPSICTIAGIMINSKLTIYRIEQLEKKQDKHNDVIERVYKLEQTSAVMNEEIKEVSHRIDGLERGERR